MKLFIIGNGFDLGHGLPTRYTDFREYLEKNDSQFLNNFESLYDISKDTKFWEELESNLANVNETLKWEYANSIELGLESGDIGIEDTLYYFFSKDYNYVKNLPILFTKWLSTLRINEIKKRTSLIGKESLYLTFNYTMILEKVYKINSQNIVHIHGSMENSDIVVGHGNYNKIYDIKKEIEKNQKEFDEKLLSMNKCICECYLNSLKDVNKYMSKLYKFENKNITKIIVIGHSFGDVDLPYFSKIDNMYNNNAKWIVYYHNEIEKSDFEKKLNSLDILSDRIILKKSCDFFDIDNVI